MTHRTRTPAALGGWLWLAVALLAYACGSEPDRPAPTNQVHPLQRKPDGSACPPGQAWLGDACVAVGPPACADALFVDPAACVPDWCHDPESGAAQPCTAADRAAGAGCPAGSWPDPLQGGQCVAAGVSSTPAAAAADPATQRPRWCHDWRSADTDTPCQPSEPWCWPKARSCTAAEHSSGAGCEAGWWPHPAAGGACVPAGALAGRDSALAGRDPDPAGTDKAESTTAEWTATASGEVALSPAQLPRWCGGLAAPGRCLDPSLDAGCPAGWWPDPARSEPCVPAGWPLLAPLPALDAVGAKQPKPPDAAPVWCAQLADVQTGLPCIVESDTCREAPRACAQPDLLSPDPVPFAPSALRAAGASAGCPQGFAADPTQTCLPDPTACDLAAWQAQPGTLVSLDQGPDALAAALQAAATKPGPVVLLLGPGSWQLPLLTEVVPANVALRGVCPAKTELVIAGGALQAGTDWTLHGMRLRGAQPMGLIEPAGEPKPAVLQTDATLRLTQVQLGPDLQLVALPDATLTLHDAVLRDTPPDALHGNGALLLGQRLAVEASAGLPFVSLNHSASHFSDIQLRLANRPEAFAAVLADNGQHTFVGWTASGGASLVKLHGAQQLTLHAGGMVATGLASLALIRQHAQLVLHGSRIAQTAQTAVVLDSAQTELLASDVQFASLQRGAISASGTANVQLLRCVLDGFAGPALAAIGQPVGLNVVGSWIGNGVQTQDGYQGAVVAVDATSLSVVGSAIHNAVGSGIWQANAGAVVGTLAHKIEMANGNQATGIAVRRASQLVASAVLDVLGTGVSVEASPADRALVDAVLIGQVSLQGGLAHGLLVQGSGWLRNVRVQDVAGVGLRVAGSVGSSWQAVGLAIERAQITAELGRNSDGQLDGSAVHNTTAGLRIHGDGAPSADPAGRLQARGLLLHNTGTASSPALAVEGGGQLHATAVRVRAARGVALRVAGVGATPKELVPPPSHLLGQDVLLHDTVADTGAGIGLLVAPGAQASLQRSAVVGAVGAGVLVDRSQLALQGVAISRVQTSAALPGLGAGAVVLDGTLHGLGCVAQQLRGAGVAVAGPQASAQLAGLWVHDIVRDGPLLPAAGVAAADGARVSLLGSRIDAADGEALAVVDASCAVQELVVTDVSQLQPARETRTKQTPRSGAAVALVRSPGSTLGHSLLLTDHQAGLLLHDGAGLQINANAVLGKGQGLVQQAGAAGNVTHNALMVLQPAAPWLEPPEPLPLGRQLR